MKRVTVPTRIWRSSWGKEGTTITVLRPTGMAEFDGVRLNVVSEGEFVQNGVKVRIVDVEGSRILVRTVEA